MELIRTILVRVLGLYVMSQIAANLAKGDIAGAKRFILYFFLIYVVANVLAAVGDLASVRSENKLYAQLMVKFFTKLTGKDMSFYRDHQGGYLVALFRQYLDSILDLVRLIRTDITRTFVSLVLPVAVMYSLNHLLGLVALGVIIVQLIYIYWASAKINVYRVRSHEIYRKITGEVADVITNITAYKSSGVEREARGLMVDLATQETTTFTLRRRTMVALDFPRDLLTTVGVTLAFYVVSVSATPGASSVGLIVLALTYMFQIIRNVNDLPNLITKHDDLITKAYPALQYLTSDYETIVDPHQPHDLEVTAGAIELDNISFGYTPEQGHRVMIFAGLTIRISGGEQVGIVGLSGAGKSTLASLLMRFDDVQSGAIRIDGVDIRTVRQSQLRRQIAYVPQEPLLFHRTIHQNIAYFDDAATQASIERAAQAAHADGFIARLPNGYDSMVGERGVKLSGGQKQRVVIARAILKNAPIMIFDEATSALDTESERIIQQALPEILGRHTAIVIAHRLSTIAGLDRILVMHDGEIIEEGTHAQLLKLGGRYASLWAKQVGAVTR